MATVAVAANNMGRIWPGMRARQSASLAASRDRKRSASRRCGRGNGLLAVAPPSTAGRRGQRLHRLSAALQVDLDAVEVAIKAVDVRANNELAALLQRRGLAAAQGGPAGEHGRAALACKAQQRRSSAPRHTPWLMYRQSMRLNVRMGSPKIATRTIIDLSFGSDAHCNTRRTWLLATSAHAISSSNADSKASSETTSLDVARSTRQAWPSAASSRR